jgi:hypothetical protein
VSRRRKTIAVVCIALIVVAALLPLGGASLDWLIVPTAFVLLDWPTPAGLLVEALPCHAPASPCFRNLDSRGPPSLSLV